MQERKSKRSANEAKVRNSKKHFLWKARNQIHSIISIHHFKDNTILHQEEKEELRRLEKQITNVIEKWDDYSARLGYNIKTYKCKVCGRRTNVLYINSSSPSGEDWITCKKHSEIDLETNFLTV